MANIDLSKLSIQELKAMAYDQLLISETAVNTLKMINQERARQQQPAPVQPKVETPVVEEATIVEEKVV